MQGHAGDGAEGAAARSSAAEASSRAGECLVKAVGSLTGGATERRHEALMEWAEGELSLSREYAEQVYMLAEEEDLLPVYGFLLIRCGVGVLELEVPEADGDESASQQAPPGWVGTESVELDDVVLERRLRTTFRRLRGHLTSADSPSAAAAAFLAEPDVGAMKLRQGA